MAESDMRKEVVKLLKRGGLDACAVENPANPGTPDVNFGGFAAEGNIELKWAREWPVRETTKLDLPHYTREQRIWHARRWRAGGSVWLLLQVGRDWLLFDGETAARIVGKEPRATLFEHASATWTGLPQVRQELPSFLSEHRRCPPASGSRSTGVEDERRSSRPPSG